jgi:glycosyltransferase involved in cell wall biosynthesis
MVSSSDDGGAGAACYRLAEGLRGVEDLNVTLVVGSKSRNKNFIRTAKRPQDGLQNLFRSAWTLAKSKISSPGSDAIQRNIDGDDFVLEVLKHTAPDIVNLHWLGEHFLPYSAISKIQQPIVWTMHDMWTFTGGCYYAKECRKFELGCGTCPDLETSQGADHTAGDFKKKKNLFQKLKPTFVSPSEWLASEARKSPIARDLRVEVIPNAVDTNLFRPYTQQSAREILNLPQDKLLLLFGGSGGTEDKRKGFDLLEDALRGLSGLPQCKDVEIVIFGRALTASNLPFPWSLHQRSCSCCMELVHIFFSDFLYLRGYIPRSAEHYSTSEKSHTATK